MGARLSDRLIEATGKKPRRGSPADRARNSSGVTRSAEWRRVESIPRRVLDLSAAPDLTPIWAIEGVCRGCDLCRDARGNPAPVRLRVVQSAALLEAEVAGGLFAPIGVGHGKELITLLLPDALNVKRAVILTKPRLKSQLLDVDQPRYGRHFRVPDLITSAAVPDPLPGLHDPERVEEMPTLGLLDREAVRRALGERWVMVLSYAELSDTDDGDVLDRVDPDLVVGNEVHAIRRQDSARGKRFKRFFDRRPDAILCALSGSMSAGSVRDYEAALRWALRARAPLPAGWVELDDWSRALDAEGGDPERYPVPPGAILDLCGEAAREEEFAKLDERERTIVAFGQVGHVDIERRLARRIYARRLLETPGVVATTGDSCPAGLTISVRPIQVPPEVAEVLERFRKTWRIGDEEFSDAMLVAQKAKQLACGFYLRWVWPNGVRDEEWLDARSAWHAHVRHVLRYRARAGLDSPLLVWRAGERGELGPEGQDAWEAWGAVKERPEPDTEPVWLSDFLVRDVVEWADSVEDSAPGIVWYDHRAFGVALSQHMPVYAGGSEGDLILQSRDRVAAASVHARVEGDNLQYYSRNLVVTWPASGLIAQQMLGRTHRSGQRADEVEVETYQHERSLRSAFASSLTDARLELEAHRQEQKVLLATRVGFGSAEERKDPWEK